MSNLSARAGLAARLKIKTISASARPKLIAAALASCLFCVAGLLAGCQTAREKELESIELGMDKPAVLNAAGGPDRTQRWQGKDRWTYVDKQERGDKLTDVHFEDGRVVYVGDPPVPKISAAEQDRLNESANARLDEQDRAAREASDAQPRFQRIPQADEDVAPAPKPRANFEPLQ